jgi:hypothetical protein
MPFPNPPTRESLMTAQRIVLRDPARPVWRELVYIRYPFHDSPTLEIPVDSSNREAVRVWQRRIDRRRLEG